MKNKSLAGVIFWSIFITINALLAIIAGCGVQENNALQNQTAMTSQIQQAADDLSKQIDVLSANIKGATAVLKKEMPEISQKIQGLVTELQQAAREVEKSINSTEPAAARTQTR